MNFRVLRLKILYRSRFPRSLPRNLVTITTTSTSTITSTTIRVLETDSNRTRKEDQYHELRTINRRHRGALVGHSTVSKTLGGL